MRIHSLIAIPVSVAVIYSPQAQAYLDPGTGSMIIQGIIAAVGAALVGGRFYWDRIKGWLRGSASKAEEASESDAAPSTLERTSSTSSDD